MRRGVRHLSPEAARKRWLRRLDGVDAVRTTERQLRTGGGAEDLGPASRSRPSVLIVKFK